MKKEIQKEKKYYTVKVETLLPATLIYKVLAEDENQASDLINNIAPSSVQYRLRGRRDIKLIVYDFGSTMIRLIKNLMGIIR